MECTERVLRHSRRMAIAGLILIALIAVEHLWFLVLEMFLFRTPTALRRFT